jgi:hypothetical protein
MSSVYSDAYGRNKRHYITSAAFNDSFFTYTVTKDTRTNMTTGTLSAVAGATAANCPQGRILREVGRRLYPYAHPGITTMMVKVYDEVSTLSGFIDPNAPIFAVFNSDKPVEIVNGGDNNGATPHKGQPVYTTGDVIANGNAIIGGYIASAYVAPQVVQASNNNNTYIDATQGNNFVANLTYTATGTGYTYLYFGTNTGTAITPADGEVISVAIRNATGYTQTVVINQTYKSVQGYTNNPGFALITIPNGVVRTLSFISDGTLLYLNNAGNIIASTGSFTVANTANYYQGGATGSGGDGLYTRFIVKDPSIGATSKVFVQLTGFGTFNGLYSVEHVNNSGFTISGGVTAANGFVITINSGNNNALGQGFNYYVVN